MSTEAAGRAAGRATATVAGTPSSQLAPLRQDRIRSDAASVVERLGAEGSPTARPHLVATAAAQLSDALASNQLVTFRWYAQQYGVPAEEAKATLQEFVDANDSAHAVYLLAGSVKGDNRCA